MKKLLSFVLSLLIIISVMSLISISASAEPSKIDLPEFTYPTMAHKTFSETGIPYDEILACFPEKIDIKYENGILSAEYFGGGEMRFTSRLDYESVDGELVDGYWKFEVSEEQYNEGGYFYVRDGDGEWDVEYNINGNRRIIFTYSSEGFGVNSLHLYPVEGYGEQYVQVAYFLNSGLEVIDTYDSGLFYDQTVRARYNNDYVIFDYDKNGKVKGSLALLSETGGYVSYTNGIGWTDYSDETTPVETPEGFENLTYEDLAALAPTDIGCDHQWQDPLCDLPSICSICLREKGSPLGHIWVNKGGHSTCSTCNGVIYHAHEFKLPDFTKAPKYSLDETGFNIEDFSIEQLKKVETKYENGFFMVPNIEGYELEFDDDTSDFLYHKTMNAWNMLKTDQDNVPNVEFDYYKTIGENENKITVTINYKSDGTLNSLMVRKSKEYLAVNLQIEKGTVALTYSNDEKTVKYTDTYKNGILSSRMLEDVVSLTRVYYNSDLELERAVVYDDWLPTNYFPDKGWTADSEGTESVEAPEGYEDKGTDYFTAQYPHGVDFCIHSYSAAFFGKECEKCGEIDFEMTAGLIILVVVILVAVATAVVIFCKKRKKAIEN